MCLLYENIVYAIFAFVFCIYKDVFSMLIIVHLSILVFTTTNQHSCSIFEVTYKPIRAGQMCYVYFM